MSVQSLLFILTGATLMFAAAVICRREAGFSVPECAGFSLLLTLYGVFGVLLMYFIENGRFGGFSYFGAVFFVPLPLCLTAKLTGRDSGSYLAVSAPAMAVMLAVMKVNCFLSGCCGGRIVGYGADGAPIVFPSRGVELAVSLAIGAVLVLLLKGGFPSALVYPCYLVLYGVCRFALEQFRVWEPALFGISFGTLWSVSSVVLGGIWGCFALLNMKKKSI